MKALYPVALYELEPGNDGWDKGARYRIDTVDLTSFFFPTADDATEFMEIHGMKHVAEAEVIKIREALVEAGEWRPNGSDGDQEA
jgi:hypothetical protein